VGIKFHKDEVALSHDGLANAWFASPMPYWVLSSEFLQAEAVCIISELKDMTTDDDIFSATECIVYSLAHGCQVFKLPRAFFNCTAAYHGAGLGFTIQAPDFGHLLATLASNFSHLLAQVRPRG